MALPLRHSAVRAGAALTPAWGNVGGECWRDRAIGGHDINSPAAAPATGPCVRRAFASAADNAATPGGDDAATWIGQVVLRCEQHKTA